MENNVRDLLRQIWSLNEKDDVRQSRSEPAGLRQEITTLDSSRTMCLSPMLKERYGFSGTWQNAALGQTWLDLPEIEEISQQADLNGDAHIRTASRALPSKISRAQLTLFAINNSTNEATYLIWLPAREEPAICAFYGGQSDVFHDLKRFLEFLIGERVHDDSVEMLESEPTGPNVLPFEQYT